MLSINIIQIPYFLHAFHFILTWPMLAVILDNKVWDIYYGLL